MPRVFLVGMANGTWKNMGLRKFCLRLEILNDESQSLGFVCSFYPWSPAFFADGSWSFAFVFWDSNFFGSERGKLISVSEESQCCTTSMLDEICMAFC